MTNSLIENECRNLRTDLLQVGLGPSTRLSKANLNQAETNKQANLIDSLTEKTQGKQWPRCSDVAIRAWCPSVPWLWLHLLGLIPRTLCGGPCQLLTHIFLLLRKSQEGLLGFLWFWLGDTILFEPITVTREIPSSDWSCLSPGTKGKSTLLNAHGQRKIVALLLAAEWIGAWWSEHINRPLQLQHALVSVFKGVQFHKWAQSHY